MVAGHLREKSGYYYAVLNYTDSLGKRKTKWISTGLTVKGNKKRAEAILMDARRNFNPEEPKVMNGDILFADYMEKWLGIIKSSVAVPTFASYSTTVIYLKAFSSFLPVEWLWMEPEKSPEKGEKTRRERQKILNCESLKSPYKSRVPRRWGTEWRF